jgi:hypothetical protein
MVIPVSWLGKPLMNMIDGDFRKNNNLNTWYSWGWQAK